MVGLGRSSFAGGQVTLSLVGPRSIIADRVTVQQTRIRNTWLHLLNEELKLEVPADRGMYVCTSGYNVINPEGGRKRGWRAELNEQIADFVGKYERKRESYLVRLCHQFPYDRNDNQEEGEGERSPDPVMAAAVPPQKRRASSLGPNGKQGKGQRRNPPNAAIQRKGMAPTPGPSGTQKRTEKNSTAGRRIQRGKGGRPRKSSAKPSIVITSGGVQVPSTSTASNGPSSSSPTFRNKRNGCETRFLHQPELLQRTPNQVGRRGRSQVQMSTINRQSNGGAGGPQAAKRLKVQQPLAQTEPPGISIGIPSVPGPHVFIQQVEQEKGEHVDLFDIEEDDDGNGDDGIERGIVEGDDDQGIGEGGERAIVEDDDDQEGGENQLLNVGGVGNGVGGGRGERDEFGTMSDEEGENGIDGGIAGEGQIGNQVVIDEDGGAGGGFNPAMMQEFRELRIRYEDVKSIAERRLSGFSNGYLLRIRNELRGVMTGENGMELFGRSPLAFFFVQQVFKD